MAGRALPTKCISVEWVDTTASAWFHQLGKRSSQRRPCPGDLGGAAVARAAVLYLLLFRSCCLRFESRTHNAVATITNMQGIPMASETAAGWHLNPEADQRLLEKKRRVVSVAHAVPFNAPLVGLLLVVLPCAAAC